VLFYTFKFQSPLLLQSFFFCVSIYLIRIAAAYSNRYSVAVLMLGIS